MLVTGGRATGWLVLGVHISSKLWGCPSVCPAAVVANRRGVLWVVAAFTSCRVLCQVATWFLSPLGARRSTACTVAPGTYSTCSAGWWWASFPRGGPGGSGRSCMLQNRLYASRTSPSVGWGLSGLFGCAAHVTFQDRLVRPLRVLQEWDVVRAHPLEDSHLFWGDSYEV